MPPIEREVEEEVEAAVEVDIESELGLFLKGITVIFTGLKI